MSEAKHTPPGDRSFRASVARSVGGGVALVALVAAAFAGIGAVGRPGTATPVASGTERPASDAVDEADDPARDADASPEASGDAGAGDDQAGQDADDAGGEDEPAADEPTADPDAEPASEPTDEDDDAEGAEPDAPADDDAAGDPSPAIAPAEVSVQVLDGYKADGGSAARGLAASLREDGYRVVAENQALNYEVTTVLWTSGNEAAARQLAQRIGAGDVRQQPGNLSDAVDVHVVVGADRG